MASTRIFIAYARPDAAMLTELERHLRVVSTAGDLDIWSDSRIAPGADWQREIVAAIDQASIAVLLVSAHFLISEFVIREEIPRLLAQAGDRGLRLCPIVIGSVAIEHSSLARFQTMNDPKNALDLFGPAERERAWADLVRRITALSAALRVDPARSQTTMVGSESSTVPATGAAGSQPLSTSPKVPGRNDMETLSPQEMIAEEFLERSDWRNYAIVELSREDPDASIDAKERSLDRLTRLLFESEDVLDREQAAELLSVWLGNPKNESRPCWLRFKLRHALYLKSLDRKQPALDELSAVLAREPSLLKSAPLRCLRGNLLAEEPASFKEALAEFEAALKLAPRWTEPKLERIELLILMGDMRGAINAATTLRGSETRNGRTMILARANLVVARCLHEPAYPTRAEYTEEKLSALGINEVDAVHRESWRFVKVMNCINDHPRLAQEHKADLIKWLRALSLRFRPAGQKDPDPPTENG